MNKNLHKAIMNRSSLLKEEKKQKQLNMCIGNREIYEY